MKNQQLKKNLNHHIIKIFFRNNDYSIIKNRNEKINNSVVNEKTLFISKTALPFIDKSFVSLLNLVNVKNSDALYNYYCKLNKSKTLVHIIKLKNLLIQGIKTFKIFFFLDFLLLIKLKFFFSNTLLRCKILLSNKL